MAAQPRSPGTSAYCARGLLMPDISGTSTARHGWNHAFRCLMMLLSTRGWAARASGCDGWSGLAAENRAVGRGWASAGPLRPLGFAKADLVTGMVGEFPETCARREWAATTALQYRRRGPAWVADRHPRPLRAEGAGRRSALCRRVDRSGAGGQARSLVGLFAIGERPTSAQGGASRTAPCAAPRSASSVSSERTSFG